MRDVNGHYRQSVFDLVPKQQKHALVIITTLLSLVER